MGQASSGVTQSQQLRFEVVRLLWEHCRHMENMRLWFTNIYGIMIVGTLAYGSQAEDPIDTYFAVVGVVLSLLGVFIAIGFCQEHEKYVSRIDTAIKAVGTGLSTYFQGIVPTPPLLKKCRWLGWKIVPTSQCLRLRILFIWFYFVMLVASVFVLCDSLTQKTVEVANG